MDSAVTVADAKTPIKWVRFLIGALPLLMMPILLGVGCLFLPHDWYGVPVVVYIAAMSLWGWGLKVKSVSLASSRIEAMSADQHSSALEMMKALVEAVEAGQGSYRIPKLVKLVQAKMVAESLIDRMRTKLV